MLNPNQKVILSVIRDYSKTATKPVDLKTLKTMLIRDGMTEETLSSNLRGLVKLGYLRNGISHKRSYILIKWE